MAPQRKTLAEAPRAPQPRPRAARRRHASPTSSGIGLLSMRKLGEALGVEAMSLYNHVANKDELLDGMVDLVFAEIELPAVGADWTTAMRERALSARKALARHPWAIALMSTRTSPGPATLRHHDAVIGCLRSGGLFGRDDRARLLRHRLLRLWLRHARGNPASRRHRRGDRAGGANDDGSSSPSSSTLT